MPRYTDDSRERVRNAVDMADLVGTKTELRRAGPGRYMGRCCFHEERSPSLSVDGERKLYHCFGCQAGGDCFKFVQEAEGTDFTGALEFLAARYGVTMEIVDDDPRAAAKRKREAQMLALVERATAFYERCLWDRPEGAEARAYLLGRGLTEEALREFRVGFAPGGWDKLVSASEKAGINASLLIEAGLATPRRESRGAVDRFRGRITFPLCDARGQVRGFGARAMGDEQPKYLNTSENALFHKGRQLFGLHLARSAAARSGKVVLVEGYTDVVALRQIGVEHVVALMGTAMTQEQIAELGRLAPLLILALDPDGAGEAAMEKAAGLARGSRLELRVASLPDGRDPAELVQDGRAEELKAAFEQEVAYSTFIVRRSLAGVDSTSIEGRDRVIRRVAPVIAREQVHGALRESLVSTVAGELGLPADFVTKAVNAISAGSEMPEAPTIPGSPAAAAAGRPAQRLHPLEEQERTLVAMMVALGDHGRAQLAMLTQDDFQVPAVAAVAKWLQAGGDEGGQLPEHPQLEAVARDVFLRTNLVEATQTLLEVELAQLDLRRLDRQIRQARAAREPVEELHLSVQEARARLDAAMVAAIEA